MPVVRLGPCGRAHRSARRGDSRRSGVARLSTPDALVRPACEVAVEVARAGRHASPPVPVPGPMRPLLRFTRLPEAALAVVRRALDEDDDLRRRVLSHLEEAGGRGRLDEPSLLFLERPDGWADALAALAAAGEQEAAAAAGARAEGAASRRLPVVQAALDRAEASLEAARREAEALRAEVGEERRARLAAGSDLGRLRKRVGELEAQPPVPPLGHDTGAGEVDSLRVALAAAEERAARAEAVAEELRAAAVRGAPQASPAGRAGRDAPPVDHAAAAGAVAAAVDAVGALAEALARAAAALGADDDDQGGWPPAAPDASRQAGRARRADPVRRPAPLPPAVFDDTVAAAEHLLRLPGVRVLVDGYNVTITSRGDLPLEAQRRWLLDAAAGAAARTGATFDIVFDGAEAGRAADGGRPLGVQVRFTAPDEEADDVVLDLACRVTPEHPVVVVSDDRRVRDGARRLGANVLGVAQLVDVLRG